MHDRVNNSNNSNDRRDTKSVQERPQKRKWSEKISFDRKKNRSPKRKLQRQPLRTMWSTKLDQTTRMPSKNRQL